MLQDIRFAFTLFKRSPGVALIAVLSLALGIGANTAIFSVVNTVLIRPLDYASPDRLVRLWETFGTGGTGTVSAPNFFDWREQNRSFVELAAYSTDSFNLTGDGQAVRVVGTRVSPELGSLLGVPPLRGRFLLPDEAEMGSDPVVVLSFGLWQRRFGGADVVGRTIQIGGTGHEVVGVMPESFHFPPRSDHQLWVPLTLTKAEKESRGSHWMTVIGRLKESVTLEAARADMRAVAARIEERFPDVQDGRSTLIRPWAEAVVGRHKSALLTLWATVGLVLIIACVNVANLLLARAVTRRREMAVRMALGAGRFRLIRQVMTEVALLALMGAGLGLVLGKWGVGWLAELPGSMIPPGKSPELDLTVLGVCVAVSLVAAGICGLFPALRTSRNVAGQSLRERSGAGGTRDRLRSALAVAEIALALLVMIGAGLLLRSYSALLSVPSGLEPEGVLTARLQLPRQKYSTGDNVIRFFQDLERRIGALPGVRSAGFVDRLPLQSWGVNGTFVIQGRPVPPPSQRPLAEVRGVFGDYFSVMGMHLLRGRFLEPDDGFDGRNNVIINETMAKRHFSGQEALDQRIYWDTPQSPDQWMRIVGVVSSIKNAGLERDPQSILYLPLAMGAGFGGRAMTLTVKTSIPAPQMADAIRRQVSALDPQQPIFRVLTMEQVLAGSVSSRRFNLMIFASFAALALALAVAGVFGVISYSVNRRRQEMAVRMALGARPVDVLNLVLRSVLVLDLAGIALGVLGSLWLTRYIQSQLFSVRALDPVTIVSTCVVVLAVTMAAALWPARRASSVDPVRSLRAD